jgi:hypothetical protein
MRIRFTLDHCAFHSRLSGVMSEPHAAKASRPQPADKFAAFCKASRKSRVPAGTRAISPPKRCQSSNDRGLRSEVPSFTRVAANTRHPVGRHHREIHRDSLAYPTPTQLQLDGWFLRIPSAYRAALPDREHRNLWTGSYGLLIELSAHHGFIDRSAPSVILYEQEYRRCQRTHSADR